jgi:hypothetical protein
MFTTQLVRTGPALVLGLLLTACGGGGGGYGGTAATPTPTATGTLLDAPVAGATYKTSSGYSGITDSQGQFRFSPGDTVTFTAAGVTLGSALPIVASDGTSTVTPVNLVSGATGVTDPKVSAIAVLLNTLNKVSAGTGTGQSGVFVMPTDASLIVRLQQLGASAGDITSTQIQTILDQLYGASRYTVTSTSDAQAGVNQGLNSQGVVGTVWSGSCTCGDGASFYFEPNGTLTGFTGSGHLLAGTWSGSPTATGGVQLSLVSPQDGGYSKNGVIPAGSSTGTADIWDSGTNAFQGTFTFTKVTSTTALGNTNYLGGWYATYTPNATGTAAGDTAGVGYLILAADGTFHGISDGSSMLVGTWDPSTGIGTGSVKNASHTDTFTLNAANRTGTFSVGGTDRGSLSFSRTGTLAMTQSSNAANIPLLLNVTVSWPANIGNVVSSLALSLTIKDSGGNNIASGIKSEINPLGIGAIANTTTDNIAVSYPRGSAVSYSLSVGSSNCSITGGGGSVVDANSGNAVAYPTVAVVCH